MLSCSLSCPHLVRLPPRPCPEAVGRSLHTTCRVLKSLSYWLFCCSFLKTSPLVANASPAPPSHPWECSFLAHVCSFSSLPLSGAVLLTCSARLSPHRDVAWALLSRDAFGPAHCPPPGSSWAPNRSLTLNLLLTSSLQAPPALQACPRVPRPLPLPHIPAGAEGPQCSLSTSSCPQRLGLHADCAKKATDPEGRGIMALENEGEDYWSHRGGNPGQCPVRGPASLSPRNEKGDGEGPLHNVAGRCGLKIWKGDQHAVGALGAAGGARPGSHLGEQPGCLQGGGGLPCHWSPQPCCLEYTQGKRGGVHRRHT